MSVGQLFARPNHFSVPMYQRPYSWNVEEAGQLLEDIATAAGIDEGQVLEPDYFLGAILLLDANAGSVGAASADSGREYEIVDGLQRLVTLMILSCALRDLEPSPDTELARRLDAVARLHQSVTPESSRIGLPGEDWNVGFEFVVAPGGCTKTAPDEETLGPGQLAVIKARDRLMGDLANLTPEQRAALATYICDSCHFVVVTTSDIDRAHRIFIVLNDRGRPLQKKDILKAQILRAVEPEHRQQAVAVWREAEARLGNQMETFLSHLRSAYGYPRMQVISGVRRVVSDAGSPRAFVLDIFKPMADAYATILSATNPKAEIHSEFRRVLVGLSRINGAEWVPSALRVLCRGLPPALTRAYLEEIERAAFLMRLVCLGAGRRSTRFAKIASELAADDLPEPTELYEPTREELRTIAYNLRDLHTRNVQACKGILLRINDELQPDALYANPTDYSIEHVLPQRPKASSLWRKWFPDSEERAILTASIGNLVLITERANGLVSNEEYARKKEVNLSSATAVLQLDITKQAFDREFWRAEQIRAREASLISALNELWRLGLESEVVDKPAALKRA